MTHELAESIYWRGRQWAVTGYGIEALDGLYHIPWNSLDDEPARKGLLREMQGHYWLHADDFTKALEVSATMGNPQR